MEIIYYIINFLILIGLILLIGRKTIVNIFRSRRTRIEAELDAAESPQTLPKELSDDPVLPPESEADDPTADDLEEARRETASRLESLKAYTAQEFRELSFEKVRRERRAMLEMFRDRVEAQYRTGAYAEQDKQRNEALMDEILSKIALTPGDRAYLKHHDVLYVTLSSAYPLPDELVRRADEATSALLAPIAGKTSFWVKQDSTLIGGFRLRIGDTVYDGSVSEQVYLLAQAVEKLPITEEDTVGTLMTALEAQIDKGRPRVSMYQLGRVISVSDGICWMDGLADIMYGEVVEFDCGERGMVLDIQKDRIGCVIFGGFEQIESYSKVRRVGRIASVPVGEGLLGRVVDGIGNPIDGRGCLAVSEKRPIECPAPGILDRAAVSRPLHTGIKAIDAMVPIGKGQRELLVGDRQTGKTAIVLDTILNQKGKNVVCIYVSIGQKETSVADFYEKLAAHGASEYTVIVSGTASESAAMQYIAPFAATAMGEYFMYAGRDVLIIYDDLSKHAVAYRELSLLLQRPSGREAFPGDIFYLHSRLLERSAQLSEALGGGSMTALPIIETQAGDISSYIPTNVISITDGQIFLEADLFHEGQRPAVNVGLSVSRVGSAAQTRLMKQVSSDLRTKLAQYRELVEFTQFGADVDEITKRTLNTGAHLTEALKQSCFTPLEDWKQALLLYAVSQGFADSLPVSRVHAFEKALFASFEADHADLVAILRTGKKMDADVMSRVREAVAGIVEGF